MSDWDIGHGYDDWKTTEPEEEPERPTLEDMADCAYERQKEREVEDGC